MYRLQSPMCAIVLAGFPMSALITLVQVQGVGDSHTVQDSECCLTFDTVCSRAWVVLLWHTALCIGPF